MEKGKIEAATEAGDSAEALRVAQLRAAQLLDHVKTPREFSQLWATYEHITARLDNLATMAKFPNFE